MRVKEMIDNLGVLVLDRLNSLEDTLALVVSRGEVVEILKSEIELMREERRELLNRLMARDFETLQTYTDGGQEEVNKELKPEEDEELAGEIVTLD